MKLTRKQQEQIRGCALATFRQIRAMVRLYRAHGNPERVRPFSDHIGMVYPFGYVGIERDGRTQE